MRLRQQCLVCGTLTRSKYRVCSATKECRRQLRLLWRRAHGVHKRKRRMPDPAKVLRYMRYANISIKKTARHFRVPELNMRDTVHNLSLVMAWILPNEEPKWNTARAKHRKAKKVWGILTKDPTRSCREIAVDIDVCFQEAQMLIKFCGGSKVWITQHELDKRIKDGAAAATTST